MRTIAITTYDETIHVRYDDEGGQAALSTAVARAGIRREDIVEVDYTPERNR